MGKGPDENDGFWGELQWALRRAHKAKCPECGKRPRAVGFDVQQKCYKYICMEHGMWDIDDDEEGESDAQGNG